MKPWTALRQFLSQVFAAPEQVADVDAMREAEQRRSEIMARLRALEMRYDAAARKINDVD